MNLLSNPAAVTEENIAELVYDDRMVIDINHLPDELSYLYGKYYKNTISQDDLSDFYGCV